MFSITRYTAPKLFSFALLCGILLVLPVFAQVSGKVGGTIKDQTGAVIPNVLVTITEKSTGVPQRTSTNAQGSFTFPVLRVGTYDLDINIDGFKPHKRSGLIVDVGSALQVDVALEVATVTEEVSVTEQGAVVEASDTQLGQVIVTKQITEVPLNGRNFTDLFAIQAGVTPLTTSAAANSSSGGGFGTVPVAGNTNTGQFSIHGQRESANGFYLNGASVQETIGQQAGIIPNLDSISEFRILTSNSDAEYGNFSGGLVNVVTKSGENALHGSFFEFLRNTSLDSRGFFSPDRGAFQQNQYGGTLGGPLRKDKTFFFGDYQGQRTVQGMETGVISIPSVANRGGDFSDSANTLSGTVNGNYLWPRLVLPPRPRRAPCIFRTRVSSDLEVSPNSR